MLKIKDNIQLKELEKFGFKIDYECGGFANYIRFIDDEDEDGKQIMLRVFSDTKEIIVHAEPVEDFVFGNLTTLFDIIQAGLVEKVSD